MTSARQTKMERRHPRLHVLNHCLHDHTTKLQMHAAVAMPDHVHLLFTPLRDLDGSTFGLAEIMQGIKALRHIR